MIVHGQPCSASSQSSHSKGFDAGRAVEVKVKSTRLRTRSFTFQPQPCPWQVTLWESAWGPPNEGVSRTSKKQHSPFSEYFLAVGPCARPSHQQGFKSHLCSTFSMCVTLGKLPDLISSNLSFLICKLEITNPYGIILRVKLSKYI